MSGLPEVPFAAVVATGITTVVLASALAYVLMNSRGPKTTVDDAAGTSEVDKDKYPGGQIAVYYGTQTGTAESFARQLEREGADHGFLIHVLDLEEITLEDLVAEERKDAESGKSRAIFLCATYGEGEAPDNATIFVNALKEEAGIEILYEQNSSETSSPQTSLVGLDYCVFGLGNRQYDHFNAMGKFFDYALDRVGGTRLVDLGVGDDDEDLEGDFESWKDTKLWPALKSKLLPDTAVLKDRHLEGASAEALPDCQYKVEYIKKNGAKAKDVPLTDVHASTKHYFAAVDCPVKVVKELQSQESTGSTVHLEIDISKAGDISYQTADNLGVLPLNRSEVVESVAKSLSYDLDAFFTVMAAPGHEWHGAPFPMPISVRECLTRYCDLTSAPRRSDLKLLSSYAKDPTDKKALLRMSSKEGRAEYKEKILEEYIGFCDILKLCPSIEMPLEHLLGLCPHLQTRFFTISSSSSVHPKTIHLTVVVTQEKRKNGSMFKGVCSNYLAGLRPGKDKVRVFNRPSSFRLPPDPGRPIIMIGPGTGVAPMRALLQERSYQKAVGKLSVGKNTLYFGCRRKDLDYLYESEFQAFQKAGVLDNLRVAFSREQEKKVYVQHLLDEDSKEIWSLVNDHGAYIYVCGGVKMGQDVSESLKQIVGSNGGLSPEASKDYLAKLSTEGRFVQELWA